MTKIQIIGTHQVIDETVRVLHRAGVVQIEKKQPTVEPLLLDADAARQHAQVTSLVARLDALLGLLPKRAPPKNIACLYDEQAARPVATVIADTQNALGQLDAPAQDLARRHDQLQADQVTLPRYAKTMRQLAPLAADLVPLKNYETVALLVERKFSAIIEMLRGQLPAITNDQFELVARDLDLDTTAAILVFPRDHSATIHALLGRESITQVQLPAELTNVPFKDALATIEIRLTTIPGELEKIQRELNALADLWRAWLAVWSAILRDHLQALNVRERFGATRYTFVINGWMPRNRLSALRDALARAVGVEIVLEEIPLTEAERDQAPVVLANPRAIKPFEFLVRLMALPRYGTLDPTPLMAIFLPIFFGMILGDVAYGTIVFIGAWYLLRKAKPGGMTSLLSVILYCALWSIAFGFVYGEFFGELGAAWFRLPAFFSRGQAVISLFIFSLAFGVIQVSLGFALGIYQSFKMRQRHELLDRIARVIALSGIFAIVAVATDYLPQTLLTPGIGLLMIGTALLIYGLGWIGILLGPLEILGMVGNILSYLRLAAIGLASVYLALVANELAGFLGGGIVGILVGALFHALNIALGILSPTIQSLRLHYVEFFSKFYQGGGKDFTPFRRQGIP